MEAMLSLLGATIVGSRSCVSVLWLLLIPKVIADLAFILIDSVSDLWVFAAIEVALAAAIYAAGALPTKMPGLVVPEKLDLLLFGGVVICLVAFVLSKLLPSIVLSLLGLLKKVFDILWIVLVLYCLVSG